eukprot:Skav234827  [mRNA]  locus=scaffold69:1037138:1038904:- [translate_table: standard]
MYNLCAVLHESHESLASFASKRQRNDEWSFEDGYGRSVLHEAVEFGHTRVVEEILASEGVPPLALVDAKENEFGCVPLQWAARRGHLQLIRLLLKHGAVASYQDSENRTAAQWAQLTNHLSAFALLEGAELGNEVLEEDPDNMSRLHLAVAQNNIREMKRILRSSKAKEMLLSVDRWGRTPLITAIQASFRATGPGSEKLVLQFLKLLKALPPEGMKGAFLPDLDQRDPVHWAVLAGHRQLAYDLSQMMPSEAPAEDRLLRTPLHYAILKGYSDVATALMKAGADPREADIDGMSVLSFAEIAMGLGAPEKRSVSDYVKSSEGDPKSESSK